MSGRFRMNEGDWVCADAQCGNVNFARRTSCNRCGKEKTESSKKKKLGTEIGKVAAEKSRGLFSADDWQCSNRCGNVNWARRQQCNMCNAPKYGEVEERTGYGGGYNERENVEYIEREDSDGEFDEFGRKKKQYRGKLSSNSSGSSGKNEGDEPNSSRFKPEPPKMAPPTVTHPAADNDDEEDDDDDDDADLSKYDLSGWGDDSDDDSKSAKDKNDKVPAKSHSRSRSPSSRSSRSRSPRSHSSSKSQSPRASQKRKRESQSRSRSRSSSYDSRSSGNKRRRRRSSSGSEDRSRSSSNDRSKR